jgi:hypothetical protein
LGSFLKVGSVLLGDVLDAAREPDECRVVLGNGDLQGGRGQAGSKIDGVPAFGGKDGGDHEGGKRVGVAFDGTAEGGGGVRGGRGQEGAEGVKALGGDVRGAVFDENAFGAVAPEVADFAEGGGEGAVAQAGDGTAGKVERGDDGACGVGIAGGDGGHEGAVGGGGIAGEVGLGVGEAEEFRLEQWKSCSADVAKGLAEVDAAVPAGGACDLEEAVVGPAFEGGLADADGLGEGLGGEEPLHNASC